ncbi:MAG: hypothetical protein ACI3WR_06905 [Oscillospiraceae bacterium]
MTGKEWLQEKALDGGAWYVDAHHVYPELLSRLYARLRGSTETGEIYRFQLELKDMFEALAQWYCLSGLALAQSMQDAETVAAFCDPDHPLSFGDWAQNIPTALLRNRVIANSSLGKILAHLRRRYDADGIVAWRNYAIGHGALQPDTSPEFLGTLSKNLCALTRLFTDLEPWAAAVVCLRDESGALCCAVDGGPAFPTAPFIRAGADDFWLLDSYDRSKKCREKSYLLGQRNTVDLPLIRGLSFRYYGACAITAEGGFDDAVFTGKLESALQHYHEPEQYLDQPHYREWLVSCLHRHSKGVFLLRSDTGTGKSAFAHYLDGYGKKGLAGLGFTCRAYHFSRFSFRSAAEFSDALQGLFSGAPENGDGLYGRGLPSLDANTAPDARGPEMAAFLLAFQQLHQKRYSRDKLLLILDGIDECQPEETGLLCFVPSEAQLSEGVYVLVTCCAESLQGSFQQDFLDSFAFTEQATFSRTAENAGLLQKLIRKSVTLSGRPLEDEQAERIGRVLDWRFTGLPVIKAVLANAEDLESALTGPSLLGAYLSLLERFYGAAHYAPLLTVLLTLALAVEPLGVRLLSQLSFGQLPPGELLAIMRDLSPLLSRVQDGGGQPLYVLGHPAFAAQLRSLYPEKCRELVEEWEDRLAGEALPDGADYDLSTYVASGVYTWETEVRKQLPPDMGLLERTLRIAETFSQACSTKLYLSRILRTLFGVKAGCVRLWKETRSVPAASAALHSLAVMIPKLVLLENTALCMQADSESEELIRELPESAYEDARAVQALFFNYANRMALMSRFGDAEKEAAYYGRAYQLLERHPEWIPNVQQIPFIHNAALNLLHSDPVSAMEICDRILSFPESRDFDRARALLLKGDALKVLGRQAEAGACFREAAALAGEARPLNRVDAETYPNALQHLGGHLLHVEGRAEEAIEALTQALDILTRRSKAKELPDRFAAARLLSEIGGAYYRLDTEAGGTAHREACLGHMAQSLEVFRLARREGIGFRPDAAEAPYVNAAYAYRYYGLDAQAAALLEELKAMQQDDACGNAVKARCDAHREALQKGSG